MMIFCLIVNISKCEHHKQQQLSYFSGNGCLANWICQIKDLMTFQTSSIIVRSEHTNELKGQFGMDFLNIFYETKIIVSTIIQFCDEYDL